MAQRSEHSDQIPVVVEDVYPLTPLQAGMLFHALYAPGSQVYVNQYVFSLRGSPDAAALRRAWQGVVEHHPVLRTSFAWEGMEKPVQVVRRGAVLPWEEHDWRGLPREAQRERRTAYLEADRERGFDLAAPPLMRVSLLRTADDVWELVWSYHHLLVDGWSMGLVLRDVFALYEADLRGSRAALPRSRPFRDYVAWLQRQDLSAAEAFWRGTLEGFTAPTPLGIDRAAGGGPDGADAFGHVERRLSAGTTAALLSFAREQRVTPNTLWQGAWGVLLGRYSGEEDVVFGATVSGREAGPGGLDEMVGLFINTLPVRLDVDGGAGVSEFLGRLQEQQAEARRYPYSPLPQVREWSGVPAGQPLFESIVVFENHPVWDEVGGGEHGFRLEGWDQLGQSHYALTLSVLPGERTSLRLEYDGRRIGGEAAERMAGHLEAVLEGLAADPARRLREVPLLRGAERERVLEIGVAPAAGLSPACIHELFAEQAARTPDAPAVVHADGATTYAELERGSGQVARRLRAHGVGPETVVGVLMEHSPDVPAVLLGILRAGGVYLPLDPGAPAGRLEYVLRDAGAALVLAQPGLEERIPSGGPAVLSLDTSWADVDAGADAPPLPSVSPDNAAYVIYTSGSTGLPKGVAVPHGAAAAHLREIARAYGHTPADRVLAFASLTFDQSIEDILAPLVAGASVVVRDPVAWTPAELAERVRTLGITSMNLPTAYWAQLARDHQAAGALKELLEVIVVGGEALASAAARAWDAVPGGPMRLINGYGPTETVVTATMFEVPPGGSAEGGAGVPIGRPLGGRAAYVLDGAGEPAPAGVPGELCIGGGEVARGYLGRPELTADRFVPDAFGGKPGARLYRTGDRVRWLESGQLEFLGRTDEQVKIRGFRIEPGEVEAALLADARVRGAAVVAREDAPGERRLVAYVAPAGAGELSAAELRAGLRERLPEHMVPAAFVVLDRLPLNANGKVDRRALPVPEPDASGGEHPAPRTATEEVLAGIWASVLGVERVGVEDGFFELGGHSLLAMQVAARVRQALGMEVPLRAIFEAPTMRGLAGRVDSLRNAGTSQAPPLERVPREGPLPLSFAQQRLWLTDRIEPGSSAYNMPAALRLRGPLDAAALRASLDVLVRRHETLRTCRCPCSTWGVCPPMRASGRRSG
jgi:amino acid adenylation domain-containing protein